MKTKLKRRLTAWPLVLIAFLIVFAFSEGAGLRYWALQTAIILVGIYLWE